MFRPLRKIVLWYRLLKAVKEGGYEEAELLQMTKFLFQIHFVLLEQCQYNLSAC